LLTRALLLNGMLNHYASNSLIYWAGIENFFQKSRAFKDF